MNAPISNGSGCNRCSRPKNLRPAVRRWTIAASSMASGGSSAPGRPGAICPTGMGPGKRGPAGFSAGARRASGTASWRPSSSRPRRRDSSTGTSILSRARSVEPTSMPLGPKKGRGRRSAGPQPRGLQYQSPPARCRRGQPHAAGADAGAPARGRGLRTLKASGAVQRPRGGRPKRRPRRVAGDKADSRRKLRPYLRRHGLRITIPRTQNEHWIGPFDRALSRLRERVERVMNRLKQHRRLATRYETCAVNDRALWMIAATLLWL
jgi:hypothetical protein